MLLLASLGFVVLALFELLDNDFLFEFQDMGVFMLTFLQSFVVLYFIHWKWNRFDLSFDAVVKYFAAGFLLSTFLAFGFETLVSIILKLMLSIVIDIFFPSEIPLNERKMQEDQLYFNDDYYTDDDQFDDGGNQPKSEETSEFEKNHPGEFISFYIHKSV